MRQYEAAFTVVCCYAAHRRITVAELPAPPQTLEKVTISNAARQCTSPRNGILKAAAVERWAKVVADAGIETMQDVKGVFVPSDGDRPEPAIKEALLAIPGQRSGVSLEYFILLLGDEMRIKPDRRVKRFVDAALGAHVEDNARVIHLLQQASTRLAPFHPNLTPRRLDKLIWERQRAEPAQRLC